MTRRPIRRSAQAEEDLIAIWHHIARENERAADRLLDRIDARCQQLETYPFSGAERPDIAPGIRHLVVREYLVLYRVDPEDVVILRVLHGRRNIGAEDFDQ